MDNAASAPSNDAWDPDLYHRFVNERAQPFFDLLALCEPGPGGQAVDLGCGPGELTVELHRRLLLGHTTGIDQSQSMLDGAADIDCAGVDFKLGDIATFGFRDDEAGIYDLVFSNAALHWVDEDHREVVSRWCRTLRPGGQLAIQVPINTDHLSHLTAAEIAYEEPFLSAFDGHPPPDPARSVLQPEEYAELLYELGFAKQNVRLQIYGHLLPSTSSVVDWISGTSLVRFRSRLDSNLYNAFIDRYRERLIAALGDQQPYFYTFRRILIWGELPR